MWMALAGLGMKALQQKQDEENARKQNILNAHTAMYSPWTGLRPGETKFAPSLIGALGEGAIQGYAQGKDFDRADKQDALMDSYMKGLDRKMLNEDIQSNMPSVDSGMMDSGMDNSMTAYSGMMGPRKRKISSQLYS